MKIWNDLFSTVIVVLFTLLLVFVSDGRASSVQEVTLEEMLQNSEFVFEGRALSSVGTEDVPRRIYTYVTFEIAEIIKGDYPDSTITLRFLGGTAGNVTMAVSDMQIPQNGEHGLYFVESLRGRQVHPFYGWSQGHFLVERDETGIDRVMTNRKQPFAVIESNHREARPSPDGKSVKPLSTGVARGLVIAREKQGNKGYAVREFKNILKEWLQKGQ